MRESRLYHFSSKDFLRIGKLLADRDVFIVFYHLANSLEPSNIAELASAFRREPAVISEILLQLTSLGVARRRGGLYATTSMGRKVMSFCQEITKKIELRAVPTEAPSSQITTVSFGPGFTSTSATNNTVLSTFSVTSCVIVGDRNLEKVKANKIAGANHVENELEVKAAN